MGQHDCEGQLINFRHEAMLILVVCQETKALAEAIKAARNAENDQCRREVERLRARQESRFQAIIAKGIELSYTADQ